jgi:type IV pilus assembly protein PilO
MNIIDELNSLDTSNPGSWPAWVKVSAVVLLMIIIGILGYKLFIQEKIENLDSLARQEDTLKITFKGKQQKAAQLDAYKAQLEEMEVILQSMLRQLPSKTEMSDLIVDISQTALASGIDNKLFEPGTETLHNFYAEKPISLKMVGGYHQFGEFVSGVASLPRVVILTMHDISLKPIEGANGLVLEGTAKTYRYLDDDEQAAMDAKAEQEAGKGGRK